MGLSVQVSPSGVTSLNKTSVYQTVRVGAKARYAYGSLSLQRNQVLPWGWELNSRAVFQVASTNLLSSEQLGAGGASTVRGYQENSFIGDEGYVFSNDFLTPVWRKSIGFLPKGRPPLESRGVIFFDASKVDLKDRYDFIRDRSHVTLASAGIGVRAALPHNFSFSADYGFHLSNIPDLKDDGGRGHVKLVLAY